MPPRPVAAVVVNQKKHAELRMVSKGNSRRTNNNADFDPSAREYIESTGRSMYTDAERREMEVQKNRKLAAALTERRDQAAERAYRQTHGLPHQNEVKDFYDRKAIQIFVAGLIILNFFVSAVEAQMFPIEPIPGKDDVAILAFTIGEYFFAYVFLIELLVNFYGNYFWDFWKSAWNIFDFLIVLISLLALYMQDLPGISVLRLFRAFRVVRLFKRIKTMRVMMDSILRSLPGMSIAFIALFLIMGIYGIIGVNFWAVAFPLYFGDFLKAVLSLLQIMTFDSWSSGIARPIILSPDGGAVAAIYFISYVFIASIIMANVLIALLLDEFMNTSSEVANDDEADEEELDKVIETNHAKLEEKFMGEPRHSGFVGISALLAGNEPGHESLMNQSHTQGNIVVAGAETPPSGGPSGGMGIEMAKFRRTHPSNVLPTVLDTGDLPVDSNDPAWRTGVDKNIKTLTLSLEKLHSKLDQLLPQLLPFNQGQPPASQDYPSIVDPYAQLRAS